MKAEGFSCPCLYWGVSIKNLTKCVNLPIALKIKDVLSSVRDSCECHVGGADEGFSMGSRGSVSFLHYPQQHPMAIGKKEDPHDLLKGFESNKACQVWWLTPVIPAPWEAEPGGS